MLLPNGMEVSEEVFGDFCLEPSFLPPPFQPLVNRPLVSR
jgi:hypothetical protein